MIIYDFNFFIIENPMQQLKIIPKWIDRLI